MKKLKNEEIKDNKNITTKEINISRSHKKNFEDIKKSSKTKLSDIFLYIFIILTFGFLVFTIIDLFISIKNLEFSSYTKNFLFSFIMIIVATSIYLFIIYFDNKKLEYPEWFKCIILGAVFVFTIIYPLFNLYSILITDIIFNIILGFILSIIGVSIFYNNLKTEKNIVKIKPRIVLMFSLFFTVSVGVFIEIIEFLIKLITKPEINSLNDVFIDLITISITALVTSITLFLSLKKDKKIINACLINKV